MVELNQALKEEIISEARAYYEKYYAEQLNELLAQEWAKAEGYAAPIRSDDNPGIQIIRRIIRRMAANALIVTATVNALSADVLNHMYDAGYDIEKYRIPIAIMISITVNSVLENWKDEDENNKG